MKKQKLTPEQENFFKELGKIIDRDLANLLSCYTLEEIMKAQITTILDKDDLRLTIQIKIQER